MYALQWIDANSNSCLIKFFNTIFGISIKWECTAELSLVPVQNNTLKKHLQMRPKLQDHVSCMTDHVKMWGIMER